MKVAFDAESVRTAEAPALAAGEPLMLRAAEGIAAAVRNEPLDVPLERVFVFVGGGNNGGDGLYAAAILAEQGVGVGVVATTRDDVHPAGFARAQSAGVRFYHADDGPWAAQAARSQVWVDAIAGIGTRSGGLRAVSAALVERAGQVRTDQRVLAVDIPSGLTADSGIVDGPILRADRTITMGALKAGLLLPPAAQLAGTVDVLDLGLQQEFATQPPAVHRLEPRDLADFWPVPGAGDHKYSRGVLGAVAGSAPYPGAAVLTVGAALRTGCGMVRFLGDRAVGERVLDRYPEAVLAPGRVQALVLGPGLATRAARDAAREQLAEADAAAQRAGVELPALVWDAGALAAMPRDATVNYRRRSVATPHAGELAALLTARGLPVRRAEVERDPARWVRAAADRTGVTVLLKGAVTLVAAPQDRASTVLFSQADGTPWLATAGSGDVLAGILGALLATSEAPPALLAAAAALVHGRAAHHANPGGPVMPSDVVEALPRTIAGLLALEEGR